MLAKNKRITERQDFLNITKFGDKQKFHCCIVHVVSRETTGSFSTRAGFVVSKSVGNAVTRNLVKRRLRSIVIEFYQTRFNFFCQDVDIVIKALPRSAQCNYKEMRYKIHKFLDDFLSELQQ